MKSWPARGLNDGIGFDRAAFGRDSTRPGGVDGRHKAGHDAVERLFNVADAMRQPELDAL